jgi:hypothetical protein
MVLQFSSYSSLSGGFQMFNDDIKSYIIIARFFFNYILITIIVCHWESFKFDLLLNYYNSMS